MIRLAELSAMIHAWLDQFVKDTKGATAIEYGLIAALIAVAIVTTLQFVGSEIETVFNDIATALGNV